MGQGRHTLRSVSDPVYPHSESKVKLNRRHDKLPGKYTVNVFQLLDGLECLRLL